MKPVNSDVHFPKVEESILAFWKQNQIMEKGLEVNHGKQAFVFYDGPPFATGLPHYGHILAGTLKDIVPRYWAMKGRYVQRRWGWDCHGLPVEFEMEKELGLNGLHDVEKYGIARFNEACRAIVQRYTAEWEAVILRTGRWADFRNGYRTMDMKFMESVWWVVQQLWQKELIYEGYRVMPYSWRITTPLSNFEASLNYKEVQDPALTVRFKSEKHPRYLLAWTTTPWTLPSNLALAVHPDIKYVEVEDAQTKDHYVLAKERLGGLYKTPEEYKILKEFSGKQLEGEPYHPLFDYFKDRKQHGAFRVVLGNYVSVEDGTGIVHTAPAFGEDDFAVCQKYGIPLVDPVDSEGRFTAKVPDYAGQNVKDADKAIIKDLKIQGAIVKHDTLLHNYPFCWRSDTPLIYKAISTWFVKVDSIKPKMVINNATTHWVPENLRDGRFGNWLENARDWNISRNRFWGTPIPVWRCATACGGSRCVGSIAELEKLSGAKVTDLHKHFIDDITVPCPKCNKPMKRIPEVLDCWFESGSMPYGQCHYPFENKEFFEKNFPAEFIAEGLDQTRGWFYTLTVLAAALFNRPAFKNVIVNGLVLAEDGKKMSKRLKNYPDPKDVLDTYGADSLRVYMMTSPASHADDLKFSEAGLKEVVRSVLLPYWNAYSFFVTYARADGWEPSEFKPTTLDKLSNDLDRWVVSRLQTLIRQVDEKMAIYHLYEVVPLVVGFIDELTNWYIRLNRRRFWSEEKTDDKVSAYSTLYYVLMEFTKVLAPIMPFVTEEVYGNLSEGCSQPESVHLTRFPLVENVWIQSELEKEMDLIRTVVSMGRNARATSKLKTRQPLRELLIITRHPEDLKPIQQYSELIAQELNVKKVSFSTDEGKWVKLTAKPNFKVLGARMGAKMKAISQKIKDLSPMEVTTMEADGWVDLDGERIAKNEVVIERTPTQEGLIQTDGQTTLWLDTKLDDTLIAEGRAREFVNRVQKLRKDSGLEVTDRIRVTYHCEAELAGALLKFRHYIASEVLAEELSGDPKSAGTWNAEQDIDGMPLKLRIEKT